MTKYEAARQLSDIWWRQTCELKSCLKEPIGSVRRDYLAAIVKKDLAALELAIEFLDPERWEKLQKEKKAEHEAEVIQLRFKKRVR
jgi:hypothetical protein